MSASLFVGFICVVSVKPFLGDLVLDGLWSEALPLRFVLKHFPVGIVVKDQVHVY